MVGDTASQDGYGAYHNGVKYAAYKINYKANPERLVIDGDVKVDKNQIAMDWKEVIEFIEGGDIAEKNFWLRNNEFLNIAHRGGGDLAPEDTLTAYRNAVAVGADAIEGDCHRTKDGVMVVSHDATIDRCTDGKGAIEDLTFAEIRSYDAGAKYTPDGGKTYPFKGKGIKIPTVEEVFVMLTTDLKGIPMILEIKTEKNREDAVKRVLDLIAKYDREGDLINRLQMGAFNQEALDYIYGEGEKRGMELVRCYSTEGVLKFLTTPLDDMLAPDYQSPGDVLALPWQLATSSVMNKAREANVNVNVWTVNDEFQMKWLRNVMHVDGIMTDNPALLEGLLK
jgi:glycerophosphoryl diester phosphodiesterase